MKLLSLLLVFLTVSLSSCVIMEPFGNDDGSASGGSQLTVYIIDPSKNSVGVETQDILYALIQLTDPQSNVQSRTWYPTNASVFIFNTTKPGVHNFKLTDVDALSNTNITTTNFVLKLGYNYRVSVYLGGGVQIQEIIDYNPGPGWNLVWNDEFNNPVLNAANWQYDIGTGPNGDGWGNNESEYYTSRTNNIRVENGSLVIQALNESYGGRSYTSAKIKTQGLKGWQYGKIVARIKLPYGQGIWPAFWMLGTNFNNANWPTCGEMDIMEMVGGNTGGNLTAYGSLFWTNNGTVSYQRYTNTGVQLWADYHTYEMEWNSAWVKMRIDQKDYFFLDISSPAYDIFRLPFYLILNVAVGGLWPGYPDVTTVFPQKMYVDWVRVYQKDPTVPVLNISYPQEDTTLYGQFPVRGAAEGSNTITGIYLSIDNAAFLKVTNVNVLSYGLNLSAGLHNLRLYAQDVSNKISVTNDMNVTVTWTKPTIQFTYMPPEGSTEKVQGTISGVSASMYKVSLQIFCYWLGWWIKPTAATPFVSPQSDGTWSSIYVSGGVDSIARAMKVYLVPSYIDTTANIISNAVAGAFTNRVDNHANTAYIIDPNTVPPYSQKFNDFTNNSTVYTSNGVISFGGWAVDSSPDGAVNFVTVSTDNSAFYSTNYIGSYYQSWSYNATWSAGVHKIMAYKAEGLFGIGQTNTMNFTVIVDAVKPTVNPTSTNFTGTLVTVNGTASDNMKLKKIVVNWYIWHDFGSGPQWYNNGSYDATGTTSWSNSLETYYAGTNLLEIYSIDMAGNQSTWVTNKVVTF